MLRLPIWKYNSNLRFLNNGIDWKICTNWDSICHTGIRYLSTSRQNQFCTVTNQVFSNYRSIDSGSYKILNSFNKGTFKDNQSKRYFSIHRTVQNLTNHKDINHTSQKANNEENNDLDSTLTSNTRNKDKKQNDKTTILNNQVSSNKQIDPVSKFDKRELTRLFKLVKSDWKLLILALSLLLLSVSIGMAIPKIIGLVLDALKEKTFNTNTNENNEPFRLNDLHILNFTLNEFIGLTFGALLVGCVANYMRVILLRLLSERLVVRLRSNLINKIFHQDATFFDKYKVGDLISRVSNDAHMVSRSITQKISDGCKSTIICIGGISLMFSLSVPLSLSLMVIMGPTFLVIAKIFGKQIRLNARELQESTANLTKVTEEQFNGIKTIQSFVSENNELKKFHNSIRNIFRVGKESAFINAKFYTGASVISDFSFLVVLSYGSYLVFNDFLSIGDLTAFMLYADYTGNAIFNFLSFYSELMQGAGAASRLFELMDYNSQIKPTIGNKFKLTRLDRGADIEFRDVSFAYPTRPNTPIFKNLNFKIDSGSNVCIVGPSGKGKSTIAWLLLHYYNPSSGEILIDGQDISKVSPKSLRRKIGIVQQEPILMSGTIRDNITYGLTEKVPKEKIRSVAKQCFCHGFITKLPETYDTMIGPQGTMLSGGQKQRIAIARALIKDPKILILDEATSALDVESEGAINYTFGQLMKSKSLTIVSIAHRLSTIRRSENIIVLGNEGNVVETGKFKDLFADPNSQLSRLLNENRNDVSKQSTPPPETAEPHTDNGEDSNKEPTSTETIPNEINEVLKDLSREAMATPAQIPSNDTQI